MCQHWLHLEQVADSYSYWSCLRLICLPYEAGSGIYLPICRRDSNVCSSLDQLLSSCSSTRSGLPPVWLLLSTYSRSTGIDEYSTALVVLKSADAAVHGKVEACFTTLTACLQQIATNISR